MEQIDALIVRLSMRIVMLEQENMKLKVEYDKLKKAEDGKPDSGS